MNEISQDRPVKRRWPIWIAGSLVLMLASLAAWWLTSRTDSRFVGTWEHPTDVVAGDMQAFELRGDGTGDLTPAANKRLPIDWWYDGSNICLQPAKPPIGRLIDSVQQAIGMRTDHAMRLSIVNVDESRFEYVGLGRGQTRPEPGTETRTVTRRKG